MKKGVNCNVKTTSEENQDIDTTCQRLLCSALGAEYVEMKVSEHNVIRIWACEKCAKKLRC